jgi:non-heme chloroperoxidase
LSPIQGDEESVTIGTNVPRIDLDGPRVGIASAMMARPRVSEVPSRLTFRADDGVKLVADAFGERTAPPVLLLHGGGQTRHAWGGTAATLARRGWYAVSFDLRGHGDSGWSPGGDYSLERFIADLGGVLPEFRERPALVGASLGGLIGLLAEGESAGSLLSATVFVDIAPRTEPEGVRRIVEFMRGRPEGFATLEEAADAVAAYVPHRPRPKSLAGLKKNLRLGENGRYRWHWDPAFMTSERRPNAAQDPERLEAAARRLRVPTLLVRGRMSDLLSEEGALAFLRLVPHARYVDVSGAGHMVAGDVNDVFTDAVVQFLAAERR